MQLSVALLLAMSSVLLPVQAFGQTTPDLALPQLSLPDPERRAQIAALRERRDELHIVPPLVAIAATGGCVVFPLLAVVGIFAQGVARADTASDHAKSHRRDLEHRVLLVSAGSAVAAVGSAVWLGVRLSQRRKLGRQIRQLEHPAPELTFSLGASPNSVVPSLRLSF